MDTFSNKFIETSTIWITSPNGTGLWLDKVFKGYVPSTRLGKGERNTWQLRLSPTLISRDVSTIELDVTKQDAPNGNHTPWIITIFFNNVGNIFIEFLNNGLNNDVWVLNEPVVPLKCWACLNSNSNPLYTIKFLLISTALSNLSLVTILTNLALLYSTQIYYSLQYHFRFFFRSVNQILKTKVSIKN